MGFTLILFTLAAGLFAILYIRYLIANKGTPPGKFYE